MEEYQEEVAGYFGQTTVHPIGIAAVLLLGLATLVVRRSWAWVPILVLACFVSSAQRIVVGGLDFDFFRILILFGWLRIAARREYRRLEWNAIDRCIFLFVLLLSAAFTAFEGQMSAVTWALGWTFDVVGGYLLLRQYFTSQPEIRHVARAFAIVSVPVAACFAFEAATQYNAFSVFGGVPVYTWIRDGRLRCQGPFAHPIIAGTFWGTQLPLIASLWWSGGRWRFWSVVGSACTMIIVLATNSSTSVMAAVFGLLGMGFFPLRNWMGHIRWIAAVTLVALHLVMKAPVWHLVSRVTVFDASTGWHRFFVIDVCIRNFADWWLLGTRNFDAWGLWDITNEYVYVGIKGGVLALLAFLGYIWLAFRKVGSECRRLGRDLPSVRMTWSLGCALFAHCVNFIGVAYFGQAKIAWYLLLALIATQGTQFVRTRRTALPSARPRRT